VGAAIKGEQFPNRAWDERASAFAWMAFQKEQCHYLPRSNALRGILDKNGNPV
jgi:hypothetical protein